MTNIEIQKMFSLQQHKKKNKQEKKSYTQRRFTSDDLRPVGDDDYDY